MSTPTTSPYQGILPNSDRPDGHFLRIRPASEFSKIRPL